jgi:hypothetical protein
LHEQAPVERGAREIAFVERGSRATTTNRAPPMRRRTVPRPRQSLTLSAQAASEPGGFGWPGIWA